MSELKPCPLCRGEPFLGGYDVVWCQKCSAEAHVDDWNRRPDAPSAGEWMPIETAPKDGTKLLLGHDKAAFDGWWDGEVGGWVDGDRDVYDYLITYPATHWMPLPSPPQADGAQG